MDDLSCLSLRNIGDRTFSFSDLSFSRYHFDLELLGAKQPISFQNYMYVMLCFVILLKQDESIANGC